MSGKWVRSDEGSQPGAIAFLAVTGLIASAAIGALGVLWRSHLLSIHTPWRKVPTALWVLKAYPIVYQPFLIGFGIGVVLIVPVIISTLFKRQKLHGEARWARYREIVKGGLLGRSGIVVGKFGRKVMRFTGPFHVWLEAPTRAGKGVGVIIPNLLDWLDSIVVLDIKQENYDNTAGYRLTVLGQQVFLFNPLDTLGRTARWNPLSYINRRDPVEVVNELQKVAEMLYPNPLTGEPVFAEGARTAFLGITGYIAATVDDGEDALPLTIGEVYRQFSAGDMPTRFKKIIAQREKAGRLLSSNVISAINDFITLPVNFHGSVRGTVTAKINLWNNQIVDLATSESDFDLSEFRDKRISLYLGVTPDDLDRVSPLYGLLFQQLISRNVRELPKGKRHQIKILTVLDEFASLGRCVVLAKAFSYVAGYGFRLLPAFQSIQQLIPLYGEHLTEDMMRNCEARVTLRPGGKREAERISEELGTYTFRARSRTTGTWGGGGSVSESDQRRPLMLPQEVERLPEDDLIVFRRGMFATYGRKVRYYAEKKLLERTKIPAPQMPRISIDPAIAANSLRVIEASAAGGETNTDASAPTQASESENETASITPRRSAAPYNQSAVDAARAARVQQRTSILFNRLLVVKQSKAA